MNEGDSLMVVAPGSRAVVEAVVRRATHMVGGYHRWEAWLVDGGYVRALWPGDEGKLWAHGNADHVRAALMLASSAL